MLNYTALRESIYYQCARKCVNQSDDVGLILLLLH